MSIVAKALEKPIPLAVAAVVLIGFVYWLGKKTIKDTANFVGGVASGNNVITQNQTDASGNVVTAYQGAGIVGTVGAAFNSVSGGTLASAGEGISNWVYDLLHSDTQGSQP